MSNPRPLLVAPRLAALPFAVVFVWLAALPAQAQRLLTLLPAVAGASSVEGGGSMGPAPVTAIQADLDLVRSAPLVLEAPTPDGDVIYAERSGFEDRGNGDGVWFGGDREAGYDTVVLTIHEGRLIGRFGAPGGGAYRIHAASDGLGGMSPLGGAGPGQGEPWCGVEHEEEEAASVGAESRAGASGAVADAPRRTASHQSHGAHDYLDILVAYTKEAAKYWAPIGGAEIAIQHAADYAALVFRNGGLEVTPRIVHVVEASTALDRAGRDLSVLEIGAGIKLMDLIGWDGELNRLRHEHRADLVHLFTGENPNMVSYESRLGVLCGSHRAFGTVATPESYSPSARGWTSTHPWCAAVDYAAIFVHEVGHGLGADHDPIHASPLEAQRAPYAFGHANLDVMPPLGTAMSYLGQVEPLYSTPRLRPFGAVMGIEGERDNERLLRETVHLGARFSDYLPPPDIPAQPSGLTVRWEGSSVRLSWEDNAPDAEGYEIERRRVRVTERLVAAGRTEAEWRFDDGDERGLYHFRVRALRGEATSLWSSRVAFWAPGEPIAAPSDVTVSVRPDLWADVRWTDNSANESGFHLQLLRDGEAVDRFPAIRDTESTNLSKDISRPHVGAEYVVRLFAWNESGRSEAAESAPFRWEHPDAPTGALNLSAVATGPTSARVTWTRGRGYPVSANLGLIWSHFGRTGDENFVDFEDLARGGRYRFDVGRNLPNSSVYLTLGSRGVGPAAPSDVSVEKLADGLRVRWRDNSNDETGFEIQAGGDGSWRRALTVPAGTESVFFEGASRGVVRVFAFNDRGYSGTSWRPPPRLVSGLAASPLSRSVELSWTLESLAGIRRTEARWKRASELPFDDGADYWTRLAGAFPRSYTAADLDPGTEYAFQVRLWTLRGAGPPVTVRARTASIPAASFDFGAPCTGSELCRTVTGEPVTFVDESDSSAREWTWDFGDGTTSRLRSPVHSWSAPGFYEVVLTVSDGSGSSSASRTVFVEAASPAGTCAADGETRCLRDSRFEVTAEWWGLDGDSGRAAVVPVGTNDSGLLSFFDPENWEMLIKVLDGCSVNGRVWVLGASTTDLGYRIRVTETVTGAFRAYENAPGSPAPAIVDVNAFPGACEGSEAGAASAAAVAGSLPDGDRWTTTAEESVSVGEGQAVGRCVSEDTVLCLQNRRFFVRARFRSALGESSVVAQVARVGSDESGIFWFFGPQNWELLVKVLDGCAVNGHHWVFAASATDLGVSLGVVDTIESVAQNYGWAPGRPAAALVDVNAFPEACEAPSGGGGVPAGGPGGREEGGSDER